MAADLLNVMIQYCTYRLVIHCTITGMMTYLSKSGLPRCARTFTIKLEWFLYKQFTTIVFSESHYSLNFKTFLSIRIFWVLRNIRKQIIYMNILQIILYEVMDEPLKVVFRHFAWKHSRTTSKKNSNGTIDCRNWTLNLDKFTNINDFVTAVGNL